MSDRPPHVLILMSDEHCPRVMGCTGDPLVHTPHLDRLAADGVLFDRAYCNNPICVPGRYAILTSKLPREIGSTRFDQGLDPSTLTYARHFAQAGYQTTCVGKMHFQGLEQMHGWMFRPYGDMEVLNHRKLPNFKADPYPHAKPPHHSLSDWVRDARPGMDGFIQFDQGVTAATRVTLMDYFRHLIHAHYSADRPLMLQVSWKTPHWPFIAPPEYFNHYRPRIGMPPIPGPGRDKEHPWMQHKHKWEIPYENTDDQILNARAAYWGLVQYTDHQVGLVLDVLDELGLRDDFLIIYHSDHGELAGNHASWGKGCFFEDSVRVPLIMTWPGRLPAGLRIEENVTLLDLFPTLCDYTGQEIPPDLRGQSLRPLIDRQPAAIESFRGRVNFAEFFNAGRDPMVMALRDRIKVNTYGKDGPTELYDLAADPDELTNRADDPAYADVQRRLEAEIARLPAPFAWNEPSAS
ncbi:MAG: sulfatase-like hydrolase/transferase [Phycisphaeraceae bacterium]|nr:sulfatase-like hydrolase/transferase [Phycisphaeraceae bacterium]